MNFWQSSIKPICIFGDKKCDYCEDCGSPEEKLKIGDKIAHDDRVWEVLDLDGWRVRTKNTKELVVKWDFQQGLFPAAKWVNTTNYEVGEFR